MRLDNLGDNRQSEPWIASAQEWSQFPRHQHCGRDPDPQTHDGELGLKPDSEVEAEQDEEPCLASAQDAQEQVDGDHPGQLIECDGLKEPRRKQQWAEQCHRRCKDRYPASTSHVPCAQAGEEYHCRDGDGRKEAQGPGVDAEDTRVEPREHGGNRRVVHVAECRMPATFDVIELVGVKSVQAIGRKVNQQAHRGNDEQRRGGALPPAAHGHYIYH